MQTVEGYPTDLEVLEPTALVIVDGNPQEVSSLSISRELSSSMPAQTNAMSGLTAATGSVTWNVGEDVQKRSAHPWDGNSFPPKPADEAVVFAGYGDALVRQLTGSVDETQGSIASGELSSGLVDPIDKLNRPVSFPALLATMPPYDYARDVRRVGLHPTFITDRVLRECGFYATPPQVYGCVLSATLMGSAWPEVGANRESRRQNSPLDWAAFTATDWGMGMSSGDTRYVPDLSRAGNDGRITRTVQITLRVDPRAGTSGESFLRAYWGDSHIALSVGNNRTVRANLTHNGTTTTVCSLAASRVGDADVFLLRVVPGGTFTLFANNGQQESRTAALPSTMTGGHMSSARAFVSHETGVVIGGAQINFSHSNVHNFVPTAILTKPASNRTLSAFPRITSRPALDVLKEQAEAECAAMWIDEHGTFRWVNRQILTTSSPVATLTALDDVLDIGWSSSASGVRSRVLLTSKDPSISISRYFNKIAWQGKGESLEGGQQSEEVAAPPADTDWVDVDEDLRMVNDTPDWVRDFNRARGTWAGGVQTDAENTRWANLDGNTSFSVEMEKVAESVYKFTTNAGSPTASRTIELRTPEEGVASGIWRSRRNVKLPLLQAKGIVEWVDMESAGLHIGPQNAAALEHDVGPWIQHPNDLQNLADWLSLQVREPKPVLRDLAVIPDFRRQLGDIVWIEDEQNTRIRIKLLITKIATSVAAGSAEQTIGGRILEVQSTAVTNVQLDDHAGTRTNTVFDTLWADATNAQLDDDPLGRG